MHISGQNNLGGSQFVGCQALDAGIICRRQWHPSIQHVFLSRSSPRLHHLLLAHKEGGETQVPGRCFTIFTVQTGRIATG